MSRDLFGTALGLAALSAGMSFGDSGRTYPWERSRLADLPHIDTPKPLSKRAKRRLRGKSKNIGGSDA